MAEVDAKVRVSKLKTYKEIKEVTLKGVKAETSGFIFYILPKAEPCVGGVGVGFLLSRKFGNAVKRNLARRRITAMLNLAEGLDVSKKYVFIPKRRILDGDFALLFAEFERFLKK